MKVLVIGGAGYVGSIVWPALQAQHTVYHLDLKCVPGAAPECCMTGDLADSALVARAVAGMDCIVWLAMGVKPEMGSPMGSIDLDAAFNVNVRDLFRVLHAAQDANVQRFVYASSLSVYHKCHQRASYPLDENQQPDGWDTYGFSKRLGEIMGAAWVEQCPPATFVGLRLFRPLSDTDWPGQAPKAGRIWHPLGPNDLRRLFTAAVACDTAGCHLVQASGDLQGANLPTTRAAEILGWQPQGN